MKQNKSKKLKVCSLLILVPFIFLSSCGLKIDELVDGDMYNSPIFVKNIYDKKADGFKSAKDGLNVTLDKEKDIVITEFKELEKLDPQAYKVKELNTTEKYGKEMYMSKYESSFKYGYVSKLFDARMVCGGYYQLSRVQIVERGFSSQFYKIGTGMNDLTYFAVHFRATTDNTINCYDKYGKEFVAGKSSDSQLNHNSEIFVHVDIYTINDSGEPVKNRFTAKEIKFSNNSTNEGSSYKFLGFSFKNYYKNLNRINGFGISFTVDSDELMSQEKNKGIDLSYSLMLYEAFIPGLTWN